MVKFNCRFCRFSLEKNISPKRCPYCNKENAMVAEENAEQILDSVVER